MKDTIRVENRNFASIELLSYEFFLYHNGTVVGKGTQTVEPNIPQRSVGNVGVSFLFFRVFQFFGLIRRVLLHSVHSCENSRRQRGVSTAWDYFPGVQLNRIFYTLDRGGVEVEIFLFWTELGSLVCWHVPLFLAERLKKAGLVPGGQESDLFSIYSLRIL